MMRIFVILTTLIFSMAACAQKAPEPQYVEGKHYFKIDNPIKSTSDKVEVTEFFAYSCGHCFAFEPIIGEWEKSLPEGAVLVKSPAVWRPVMALYAKVLYTARALGMEKEVHKKFFEAMMVERKPMRNEDDIQAFFVGLGVSAEKFKGVFNSFAVENQTAIADAKARGVPVQGTPEMLVDGKYRITARAAGGHEGMLKVATYLVNRTLAEKKKK